MNLPKILFCLALVASSCRAGICTVSVVTHPVQFSGNTAVVSHARFLTVTNTGSEPVTSVVVCVPGYGQEQFPWFPVKSGRSEGRWAMLNVTKPDGSQLCSVDNMSPEGLAAGASKDYYARADTVTGFRLAGVYSADVQVESLCGHNSSPAPE